MLYPEMIELLSCDIFYLRKSAQSVDKISDENPQISQIGADLLNFGKKPDFKRAIFSNVRKEISEIETSNPRVSA
ncbi:MAG: hypothetical protein Q8M95_07750 [Candidatus Methanoperedens sp.]|nr:hypothetical protein [Candidatus Methanoperedens sp.]